MKQTHTPGPWIARDNTVTLNLNVFDADGHIVCLMGRGAQPAIMQENAHLIAAAPELLEAAEEYLRATATLLDNTREERMHARIELKKAIAKARGQA